MKVVCAASAVGRPYTLLLRLYSILIVVFSSPVVVQIVLNGLRERTKRLVVCMDEQNNNGNLIFSTVHPPRPD